LIEENFENEDEDYRKFLRKLSKIVVIKDTNEESDEDTLRKIINGEYNGN